jgi:hypothetical protein
MKIIIYLSFLTVLLSGCKSYIQVFETKATNAEKEGEFYVYETDTLKITYAFWAKKGILSFAVYNKLDEPIYIDWKKSSYIDNSNKLNYWVDEEISKSASYYGGYFYSGPLLKPGFSINKGVGTVSGSKIKAERITFIPPKANYYRSQFHLLPISHYKFDIDAEYTDTIRNDKPKKTTRVYHKEFTKQNSPLVFRNFLAFSLTEDFENEFYVDNEFYLSNMVEMDYRHFVFQEKDENGNYINIRPYKKRTSFYLYVPKQGSIEYRKVYGGEK